MGPFLVFDVISSRARPCTHQPNVRAVLLIALSLLFSPALMCAEDGEIVFPAVGVRTATEQIGFAQLYPRLQGLVADTCTIPGLETDYVPQGISWAETGELLLSYYDKMARHASILVAIDWDANPLRFRWLAVSWACRRIGRWAKVSLDRQRRAVAPVRDPGGRPAGYRDNQGG